MPLEIACFTLESALRAAACGADRIELCSNAAMGGATPDMDDFTRLASTIRSSAHAIPVHVMLRPARNPRFDYSDAEVAALCGECRRFRDAGAHGFVFGILTPTDPLRVDVPACRRLVDLAAARGRPCTFHRAFDDLPPDTMLEQLEVLIALGFRAVLTSGGRGGALAGKTMLGRLVAAARGRIDIIVGGGVRSENLAELRAAIHAAGGEPPRGWWHSSAIRSGCLEADEAEIRRLAEWVRSS